MSMTRLVHSSIKPVFPVSRFIGSLRSKFAVIPKEMQGLSSTFNYPLFPETPQPDNRSFACRRRAVQKGPRDVGVTNVCLYVPSLSDIITKNAVDLGTHLNIDGTSLDSFLLVYG